MRAPRWLAVSILLALGCGNRAGDPEHRRPLDALPEGACMLLVASNLSDTWERAESSEVASALRQVVPADLVALPGLQDLHQRMQAFEARSGTNVRDDILLNMLGGRVTMGAYPAATRGNAAEVLLAAELQDAARFRVAIESLREEAASEELEIEEVELNARPALRLRDGRGVDLLLLQEERFVVLTTSEALARGAFDVHAGNAPASSLRDPACVEALEALGPQSIAVVSLGADAIPWTAQGFTWGGDGVRFQRIVRAPQKPQLDPVDTPFRREEILRSVPTGVTLTYYARPTETALLGDLFRGLDTCLERHTSGAPGRTGARAAQPLRLVTAAPPLGLDRLPFDLQHDVLPWAGDEMAFVLDQLMPTAMVPLPSIALIVEVADLETAERTLFDLEAKVLRLPIGVGSEGFTDVSYGGKSFRSFAQPVLEHVSPSYLLDGDVAILTTTRLLMQHIIDTRRVGRGQLLGQGALRPFGDFVPEEASVALFADQRRLLRALEQLATLPRLFGHEVVRGVEILDGLSVLFEHFPAGAAYVERTPTTLTLNAWMLENE